MVAREVAPDPAPEIGGLADVEHRAGGVLPDIDSGTVREGVELAGERLGRGRGGHRWEMYRLGPTSGTHGPPGRPDGGPHPPGTRHFFLATKRRESRWTAGRRTFDLQLGPFQDYPVRESPSGAEELREYRRFLKLVPDAAQWKADCRPAVLRIEKSFAGRLGSLPFSDYAQGLRSACDESVFWHAEGLERRKPTRPIPGALRTAFRAQGCVDDPHVFSSAEDEAVDGDLVESKAQQWVTLCTTSADWRLLVEVLESPPRVIETGSRGGDRINRG